MAFLLIDSVSFACSCFPFSYHLTREYPWALILDLCTLHIRSLEWSIDCWSIKSHLNSESHMLHSQPGPVPATTGSYIQLPSGFSTWMSVCFIPQAWHIQNGAPDLSCQTCTSHGLHRLHHGVSILLVARILESSLIPSFSDTCVNLLANPMGFTPKIHSAPTQFSPPLLLPFHSKIAVQLDCAGRAWITAGDV